MDMSEMRRPDVVVSISEASGGGGFEGVLLAFSPL